MIACMVFISILIVPIQATGAIGVSAYSAILIEQKTGRVLYEKKAHEPQRIASITKIMTAIIAIESGDLTDRVKISKQASRAEGSSIYLKPGEEVTLEDLVYGLMLRSGNDAAVAIAEHVGGSLEGFVYLMNEKAQQLGMENTMFANPHGLDDHEDHYSTAYDMALLTRYAMQNEKYREVSGTKRYKTWKNKNRLLTGMYEYCTGGKTGFTKRAKRTLVTTATKDDLDLIAVTLNAPSDWDDHRNLYEHGFQSYEMTEILSKGKIDIITNPFYKNKTFVKNSFHFPITEKEADDFRINYKLIDPEIEIKRQNQKDSHIVGKVEIYFQDKQIKELPIYVQEVSEEKKSLFNYFKRIFSFIVGVNKHG